MIIRNKITNFLMHNHFVGIIATAALEEHPSATSYKDFVSKDLKEHILLISLFNG